MYKSALELAHEGHLGIVKTKRLLRDKVWLPEMDQLVEKLVQSCIVCQTTVEREYNNNLHMSKLPESPWSQLSMDFYGPIPTGELILVIIDDYSRFPVLEKVHSTAATTVIKKIEKVFAIFGTPYSVRSDNGPPFNSNEFKEFSKYMGFEHRKITPYWPQANGEAERFMRNISKVMRAAKVERMPWEEEMTKFLRTYRATPHCSTGVASSALLFKNSSTSRLPRPSKCTNNPLDNYARLADEAAKNKMQAYHQQSNKIHDNNRIRINDCVLVKQNQRNKTTPPYDPKPYKVTQIKGTMITAERDDHIITRHASQFKRFIEPQYLSRDTRHHTRLIGTPASTNQQPTISASASGCHEQTIDPLPRRSTRKTTKTDFYQATK